MSTDDCKNFIESIAEENNLKKKDKWKRVKKYKEGELVLRDFENSTGDVLVIAENKNGKLSLHSLNKETQLPQEIKASLGKEKLLTEFFKLIVNVHRKDHSFKTDIFDSYCYYTKLDGGGISPEALVAYLDNDDQSLIEKEVKNIKNKTEIYPGHTLIYQLEDFDDRLSNIMGNNFVSDTHPDKVGILYDKENCYMYLEEKEGISYLKMECGGDWENPVMAFIYWSEKENRLKGFFPKGDGNIYNQETATAYGSEFEKIDMSYDDPRRDKLELKYENMMVEIEENADKYYPKAEKIGFKQLKEYILKE